jgi:hypothetical protein
VIAPRDNPLLEGNPPPFLPPRPLYFEPEDDTPPMCPACKSGGVCMCVLYTLEVT